MVAHYRDKHVRDAVESLPGYTPLTWRAKEMGQNSGRWYRAARVGDIPAIYHNEEVWMVPADAELPKEPPVMLLDGDVPTYRCVSCQRYKPADGYYEADGPQTRTSGRCRVCKRQGQSATARCARDPEFKAAYELALLHDREVVAERRKTGTGPSEAMIEAHAARIAAKGATGDGEDWQDD